MTEAEESEGAGPAPWRMDLGLAAISAAILVLEILQTRIFSYSLDPLVIYLAVGVCLLGLGASGTVLAVLPERPRSRLRALASGFAVAGAASVPVAHAMFAALAGEVYERSWQGLVSLVVLAIPYFCFGMTAAALLVARSKVVGRAYAFNLAGSGVGCLLVFPLLNGLGAEHAVGVVSWLALLAAIVIGVGRRAIRAALACAMLALALVQWAAPTLYDFPPDPHGQLAFYERRAEKAARRQPGGVARLDNRYSRWTETGRIDVYELSSNIRRLKGQLDGPIATRLFVQDASAGSILLGVGPELSRARMFFEQSVYGLGYAPRRPRDVLIIGLGGGPDVLTALHFGAEKIVGVDINRATVDLARGPFREFLGDPYGDPRVVTSIMDGRTFLRSTPDRFDLIQMTGVDTKTFLASGSLSLSENYLYTLEAMEDALGRLRPDGLLVTTRFGDPEINRLTYMALTALGNAGVAEPSRHVVVVRQGIWRALLVKRSPFGADELERLYGFVEAASPAPPIQLTEYELIAPLSEPMRVLYSPAPRHVARSEFHRALSEGRLAEHVAAAPTDLRPPSDDRPYLFFHSRPETVLADPPESLRALLEFTLQLALASLVFIFVPLAVLRRRGLALPGAPRALIYFTCLGTGFMLVEIGLFHRFVLLLGHQSYAVTVVLFGLLAGAATGSALSSRLTQRRSVRGAIAVLVVLIAFFAVGLGPPFAAAASAPFIGRLALSFGLLFVLGAGLGLPFPSGLRLLRERSLPLVAWAIGVNGFASVVGSSLAVPIALVVGLQTLMLTGAVLYVLAALALPGAAGGRGR
jgi:spermidine synthase